MRVYTSIIGLFPRKRIQTNNIAQLLIAECNASSAPVTSTCYGCSFVSLLTNIVLAINKVFLLKMQTNRKNSIEKKIYNNK